MRYTTLREMRRAKNSIQLQSALRAEALFALQENGGSIHNKSGFALRDLCLCIGPSELVEVARLKSTVNSLKEMGYLTLTTKQTKCYAIDLTEKGKLADPKWLYFYGQREIIMRAMAEIGGEIYEQKGEGRRLAASTVLWELIEPDWPTDSSLDGFRATLYGIGRDGWLDIDAGGGGVCRHIIMTEKAWRIIDPDHKRQEQPVEIDITVEPINVDDETEKLLAEADALLHQPMPDIDYTAIGRVMIQEYARLWANQPQPWDGITERRTAPQENATRIAALEEDLAHLARQAKKLERERDELVQQKKSLQQQIVNLMHELKQRRNTYPLTELSTEDAERALNELMRVMQERPHVR